MKTVISGVEVDLLFGRINQSEAGDKLDIEKDEILRGVDDASQRSLNGMFLSPSIISIYELTLAGPRVTDMILNLVPDVTTFRTTLRAIRLWAKRTSYQS
jgi:poly(A) polymerase